MTAPKKFFVVKDGEGKEYRLPVGFGYMRTEMYKVEMGFKNHHDAWRGCPGKEKKIAHSYTEKSPIGRIRKKMGLTQKQFGALVGAKASTIGSYELGKRQVPQRIMTMAEKLINDNVADKGEKT